MMRQKVNDSTIAVIRALFDSVRALLAEANVKLSRIGGSRVLDSGMLSTHDKRAGIGGMQLDTQLEELRNLQVTHCVRHVSVSLLCDTRLLSYVLYLLVY